MRAVTVQETVDAIVARSDNVVVPLQGTLTLIRGRDGRYRLGEHLDVGRKRQGIKPRGLDGRELPAGRVLTREEMERAVRALMGLK
jgi:hypothetical protein